MSNKNLTLALVVVLIIAIGGYLFPKAVTAFGGTTNYDTLGVTGLQLGAGCNDGLGSCAGSLFTSKLKGTCTLVTSGLPLVATSTAAFTCAAVGVTPGSSVKVNLAANPAAYGSFGVSATIAGTDTITVYLANFTGASTSSFPLATTTAAWNAEI